jgi:ankyrin repeat protein
VVKGKSEQEWSLIGSDRAGLDYFHESDAAGDRVVESLLKVASSVQLLAVDGSQSAEGRVLMALARASTSRHGGPTQQGLLAALRAAAGAGAGDPDSSTGEAAAWLVEQGFPVEAMHLYIQALSVGTSDGAELDVTMLPFLYGAAECLRACGDLELAVELLTRCSLYEALLDGESGPGCSRAVRVIADCLVGLQAGLQSTEEAPPSLQAGLQSTEEAPPSLQAGFVSAQDAPPSLQAGFVSAQDAPPSLQAGFVSARDALPSLPAHLKALTAKIRERANRVVLAVASRLGLVSVVDWLLSGRATPATGPGSATSGSEILTSGLVTRDPYGQAALHCACVGGHITVVKRLLEAGADTAAVDKTGQTALHVASSKGDASIVDLLLSSDGFDGVETRNISYGQTALRCACVGGHITVVKRLLEAGADIAAVDKTGQTALHVTSQFGSESIAGELLALEQSSEVNATDNHGHTALFLAASHGHAVVVRLLLSNGGRSDDQDGSGSTTLHAAARSGHLDAVDALLRGSRGQSTVDASGKHGQSTVDTSGKHGRSALHLACLNGHTEVVERLLAAGADRQAFDDEGLSPLHMACRNGHPAVVKALLGGGWARLIEARRSAIDPTALHLAARYGRVAVVRHILDAGAQPTATVGEGQTALHVAAEAGHLAVMDALLLCDRCGDIEVKDDGAGLSAVQLAAKLNLPHIVERMLSAVTHPDIHTRVRLAALHTACESGSVAVARELLSRGWERIVDERHSASDPTALQLAVRSGHTRVIELLLEAGAHPIAAAVRATSAAAAPTGSTQEDAPRTGEQTNTTADTAHTSADLRALHAACSVGDAATVEVLLPRLRPPDLEIRDGVTVSTPLHLASWHGHTGVMRSLLSAGADAAARNGSGRTALQLAARAGHISAVNLLLACGRCGDLEAKDKNQRTALYLAAERGRTRVVERLIAAGADAVATAKYLTTALHLPCRDGHLGTARALIASGQYAGLEARDALERTPLHMAAIQGREAVVGHLLGCGADAEAKNLNAVTALAAACSHGHVAVAQMLLWSGRCGDIGACGNRHGRTALHRAAWGAHAAVVEMLLSAGADADARDKDGFTPMHSASRNGHLAIVDQLLTSRRHNGLDTRDERGQTCLSLASRYGHASVVRRLLSAGADGMAADRAGRTALHAASRGGHASVVTALLLSGRCGGVDAQDTESLQSPLHAAAGMGHARVVEQLLEAGADTRLSDRTRATALLLAARGGHLSAVEVLLAADPGTVTAARDGSGRSALHLAAAMGHARVVERLLAATAAAGRGGDSAEEEEERDSAGQTALHMASQEGHLPVVQLLLWSGRCGNLEARDEHGRTALLLASRGGHCLVVELLRVAGARIHARDDSGQTALHLAAAVGALPVVAELLLLAGAAGSSGQTETADRHGRTALHLAAGSGHLSVVERLLGAGADAEAMDLAGQTSLLAALHGGHSGVAELLLSRCSHSRVLEARDEQGCTALHLAAAVGHAGVARELVAAGTDASATDRSGRTPLLVALQEGSLAVFRLVLASGRCGDLTAALPDTGETALHLAMRRGMRDEAVALLQAGADATLTDHAGVSPFALASRLADGFDDTVAFISLINESATLGAAEFRARHAWYCRRAVVLWRPKTSYTGLAALERSQAASGTA